MNYYPYYIPPRGGLFSNLRNLLGESGITFGSIIDNTQKTLGIVNQAIPLVKQVHPIVKNAKTMFRVMNEFKKNENSKKEKVKENKVKENKTKKEEHHNPTFFI